MSAQVTLLCVDDEENGLKLRKLLFEGQGHQVLTAPDGPVVSTVSKLNRLKRLAPKSLFLPRSHN